MSNYAQIREGMVVELIPEFSPDFPGVPIEDRYSPSFLALCEKVPDEVQVYWVKQEDGTFTPPAN